MNKCYIAGASGFLGSLLSRGLGDASKTPANARCYDFKHPTHAFQALGESGARIVINCAGRVGGIKANKDFPADAFEDNLLIGTNLMRAFSYLRLDKFVQIGSVCSYPRVCPLPGKEEDFWNGRPEETNAPYGLAKRALVEHGQSLSQQYKLNIIHPILANLYGPGDKYEGDGNHVIAALVKRFCDAVENKEKSVTLWGSGECTREFLYIGDAVDAIMFLISKYDSPEIINVSSGREVQIKTLAEMIAMRTGFKGDIKWDKTKPDGQPRRNWDVSKMAKLGWNADIKLEDGLKMTIADYKRRRVPA